MSNYELVNFCEIDKYASQSYCAIHNTPPSKNLGNITQVNENGLDEFNCIFGGSPCQDFSISGKQQGSKWKCKDCGEEYNPITVHYSRRNVCPKCGGTHLNKTRSSLLVEWLRIIRANKPNWGIYENVKNIVGEKFKDTFNLFVKELEEYGYNVYWKVLDAKNYGVPQHRERVYVVIIKKCFDNNRFVFPEPFDNRQCLKDYLDDEEKVEDKYYVRTEAARNLINKLKSEGYFDKPSDNMQIGNLRKGTDAFHNPQAGRVPNIVVKKLDGAYDNPKNIKTGNGRSTVYDVSGICGAITRMSGGENKPKICVVGRLLPSSNKIHQNQEVYDIRNGVICTLKATMYKDPPKILEEDYQIRRLTPNECWRLMGFTDEQFERAKNIGLSNTQLYKQAGNSIVVDVLEQIMNNLYEAVPCLFDNLKVSSYFSGIGAFESALDKVYNKHKEEHQNDTV